MDMYVARQARLGFGTIAVLTQTRDPKEVKEASAKVLAELEEMVEKEEKKDYREVVIVTALRLNLEEVKRLLKDEPYETNLAKIRITCNNVMQAFFAIGLGVVMYSVLTEQRLTRDTGFEPCPTSSFAHQPLVFRRGG